MFLPPLSVFTQCIQCAPGIPHANFVEQFVTFAERHLDKSRLVRVKFLHKRNKTHSSSVASSGGHFAGKYAGNFKALLSIKRLLMIQQYSKIIAEEYPKRNRNLNIEETREQRRPTGQRTAFSYIKP